MFGENRTQFTSLTLHLEGEVEVEVEVELEEDEGATVASLASSDKLSLSAILYQYQSPIRNCDLIRYKNCEHC